MAVIILTPAIRAGMTNSSVERVLALVRPKAGRGSLLLLVPRLRVERVEMATPKEERAAAKAEAKDLIRRRWCRQSRPLRSRLPVRSGTRAACHIPL